MPTNNREPETDDPKIEDDDAVGVFAPDLSNPEDSAKGEDTSDLDDEDVEDEGRHGDEDLEEG